MEPPTTPARRGSINGYLRTGVRSAPAAATAAVVTRIGCELRRRPFTTAASLLTLGLFLYNLAPFDFVMTTDALHASFGRAHWSLMNARVATVGAPPFAAIAHQLTGAGWFAVLGYLLALGERERRLDSASCAHQPLAPTLTGVGAEWGSALKDGLILAALVEFMQVFTRSHAFDAATVLIRGFGVAFGAWCAVFLIDSLSWSAWRRDGLQAAQPLTGGCADGLALPTIYTSHNHSRVVVLTAILAVFQVGLLIAPCVNLQDGVFSNRHDWAVQWLPFENLRRQPFLSAAAEVFSTLLTFGTLALTFHILWRRFRSIHAGWWTFGAVTLAAATCESIPWLMAGTPMDVTTFLLAWFSTYLVMSPPSALGVAAAVIPVSIRGLEWELPSDSLEQGGPKRRFRRS